MHRFLLNGYQQGKTLDYGVECSLERSVSFRVAIGIHYGTTVSVDWPKAVWKEFVGLLVSFFLAFLLERENIFKI